MFSNIKQVFILLILVLNLGACVKIHKSAQIIPSDVSIASRVNVLRATYQVPAWKETLKDEFDIDVEAFAVGPQSFLGSGKAYVFGNVLSANQNYLAFSIAIRSRKKLEDFIKNTNPNASFQNLDKYHYIIKGSNLLAWSNTVLLLINSREATTERDLKTHLAKIIKVNKSNALIYQNKNFKEALKNDKDIVAWIDINRLKNTSFGSNLLSDSLNLKENYLHLKANFDEGRINIQSQYFTNEQLYLDYKEMFSTSLNKNILINIPIENPAILTAISVKTSGFRRLLKDLNFTEKAENLVTSVTLSLDDAIDMLSGDVVIALKDIKNLEKDLENKNKKGRASIDTQKAINDMILGIGIGNEAIFDSLMNTLTKTGLLEQKEGYGLFFSELYLMKKGKYLYVTKNPEIKDNFLANVKLNNAKLLEKTEDSWFLLYADESVAGKTIKGKSIVKTITRSILKNEKVKLEEATISLSQLENQETEGETMILLKDKTVNSLIAMLEVVKEIAYQTKLRLDPNYWDGNIEK